MERTTRISRRFDATRIKEYETLPKKYSFELNRFVWFIGDIGTFIWDQT